MLHMLDIVSMVVDYTCFNKNIIKRNLFIIMPVTALYSILSMGIELFRPTKARLWLRVNVKADMTST